ncbi:MAG: S41 family peptidase [Anaerolineales bacterium]|jgi:carboxyl-terminal processing protease
MKPKLKLNFNWVMQVLFLAGLLSACGGRSEIPKTPPAVHTPTPTSVPLQAPYRGAFEAIWEKLEGEFIYFDLMVSELESLYDQYQPQVIEVTDEQAFAMLIGNILSELPSGSARWRSRQERLAAELAGEDSSYQGIGAYVTYRELPEPHVVLLEVMQGSPAETAGLRGRDSIYAIDGQVIIAEEGMQVVRRIRGPAGSKVTFTVETPGQVRRQVTVTRGEVSPQSRRIEMDYIKDTDVILASLPHQSYSGMDVDFLALYQILAQERRVVAVVIDLRIASSGSNWPLIALLTMFTDGNIGRTYTRSSSTPIRLTGEDYYGSQRVPVVILVGPDTTGFPEIFAASMQVDGRALVIGQPTPGLIEGAETFLLPDGSELTLATITFATSDGRQIGLTGVAPDVILDSLWEAQNPQNDPLLAAALDLISTMEP